MSNNQSNLVVLISAALIALVAGIWMGFEQSGQQRTAPPIQGAIVPTAKILNDFSLTDHLDKAFSLEQITGQWHLLFIGYTYCPDICPTTLEVLKQVHELMGEQKLTPPQVVFISIDPERDNPATLNQYVKYFNQNFIGVTGSEQELQKLTKQLAVHYRKVAGTSGDINQNDYLMDHSAALMLVNPQGQLQAYLTAPHTPMQIIDSILRSQSYYEKQ